MWICTSFGMFMPVLRPADLFAEGDDPTQTIQIRARRAKELDMLREKHMQGLGPTVPTPYRDYNYRAYCTPEVAAEGFKSVVSAINYEHFKETTETVYQDKALHDVYLRIWSVTTALGRPYEGDYLAKNDIYADLPRNTAMLYLDDLDGKHITEDEAFEGLLTLPKNEWAHLLTSKETEALVAYEEKLAAEPRPKFLPKTRKSRKTKAVK